MNKIYVKLICFCRQLKNDQKGASHFLEIAGGLMLVGGIIAIAIPNLSNAIQDKISAAITQITKSF